MMERALAATDFDLDDILTERDTGNMVVTNPLTGDPVLGRDNKPWTITFTGPNHKATKDIEREQRLGNFKAARQRGDKGIEERVGKADEYDLETLVKRCVGWSPITRGGDDFPFNEANARAVFGTSHMRAQATKFLNDNAAFLAKSATA